MNIPTARPLVYELDDALRPISRRYLGDQAEIEAAMAAVAAQGRSRS
jgi:2,3-bisphosphoglycerate-dependent phosphoglycerate mutase